MKLGLLLLSIAVVVMEEGSAQIINLEYWMTNLPEQTKNVPLIYLAIPGSHDSMTFGITRGSSLAPDAEPILHNLFPLFRGTIIRWTVTQSKDALEQLLIGIRYFDLRLATKKDDDNFYFTHGLYAGKIDEPLKQIKDFLDSHPGEVVILDFQHFYGLGPEDHQRLMRFLLNFFGTKLVPRQLDLQHITLNSLNRLGQQVMVVYRNEAVQATDWLWQSQALPSPWPREERAAGLLAFLRAARRHPALGYVHQAVLTPTPQFIVFRWRSTLRDKCAVPVKNEVLPVLAKDFHPGPPRPNDTIAPVNVVIADFVEMDDAIFPRTIIQLNLKLLRNTDLVYHN